MAGTAGAGAGKQFGFTTGQVVQEFGYDDDVDPAVREAIGAETGEELVDEDYGDVADGAIIWVLTPKPGREGHVSPADVEDAARTAGMNTTSAASAAPSWSGIRLTSRSRRH